MIRFFKSAVVAILLITGVTVIPATDAKAFWGWMFPGGWGGPWGGYPGYYGGPWGGYPGSWGGYPGYGYGYPGYWGGYPNYGYGYGYPGHWGGYPGWGYPYASTVPVAKAEAKKDTN